MIMIADSGSTKCAWKLFSEAQLPLLTTTGINPFFHSPYDISANILSNEVLSDHRNKISQIYFYGAGCSSKERNQKVYDGLKQVFPMASIEVYHDLMGAAIATCQDKPGIVCILGTGSNSGYYDGHLLHEGNHSLGYALGDEGSGYHLGKKLIKAFLYNRLPENISRELTDQYGITKELIYDKVYHQPNPNRYMAGFSRFIHEHKDEKFISNLIYDTIDEFIDLHVMGYHQDYGSPVHFVGSIAYYYQDTLQEISRKRGFNLGNIIQHPLDGMINYHLEKMNAENR